MSLASEGPNLIQNPSFEEADDKGLPQGFFTESYRKQAGASNFKRSSEKSHDGGYSVYVKNNSLNDARFAQTVLVEPDSYYKLSGYIYAENIEEGRGANLSIADVYVFSEAIYNSHGEWSYVELYGKTGEEQKELTIFARVGGYSGESRGGAYFDNLSLIKLDGQPNALVQDWFTPKSPVVHVVDPDAAQNHPMLFVYLALAYAVFAYILWKNRKALQSRAKLYLALGFVLALGLRLYIAVAVYGYQVDMGCFISWSNALNTHGIGGFYSAGIFCDYPPGYLWLLRLNGWIFSQFHNSDVLLRLVTKMVPIVCDLLAVAILYQIGKKKQGEGNGLVLALLYAFNPLTILLSSAWGQIDSVFALLIVLAFLLLYQNKVQFALPVYTLACLIKPQGLLFGPIALFYLLRYRKSLGLRNIGLGLSATLLLFLGVVLPFSPTGWNMDWLLTLYGNVLNSYGYATVNTANLYYLLGANWKEQSLPMDAIFRYAYVLVLLGLAGYALYKQSRNKGFTELLKDSRKGRLAILLGLYALVQFVVFFRDSAYLAFGNINTYFAMAFGLVLVLSLPKERFAMIMASVLQTVYILSVRMHERYLFAAVLLYFVDYALHEDKRSLWMGLLLTPSLFINAGIVLDNSLVYGSARGHLNEDTFVLANLLSLYNCSLLCLQMAFCYEPEFLSKLSAPKTDSAEAVPLEEQPPLSKIDRKDVLLMVLVSLVYAVFGFYRLGSTVAPQKGYTFSNPEESIVVDLGEVRDFSVLYYAGIAYDSVEIAASVDGQTWGGDYLAELNESQIFRWKYLTNSSPGSEGNRVFSNDPIILHGRYVRITAEEAGVPLLEVAFRSPRRQEGELEYYPVQAIVSHEGYDEEFSDPAEIMQLFDEPHTVPEEPDYYNSTYFDEIYHARTGYEHLHGIHPYETSHPPLGKLFMSLGIWLFGMTPFGYRFFGALIGVLMLPILYITAKYLFGSRKFAFAAMFLLAVDMLHLTQTRIATIDSYPVFFIMLSYLFMLRYTRIAHSKLSLWKNLQPLLWSGLFFGLSVASKWIGLYSGVGLAILFFASLIEQIDRSEEPLSLHSPVARRIVQTLLFCVFSFVILPFVVYYLSYIPYFAPSGGITLKRLLDTQSGMLKYHATPGLGADHPYQSPWWQWPLILKPMWYFLSYYEPEGYQSTIFAMGNPSVFYAGFVAMLACLLAFLLHLGKALQGKARLSGGVFFLGIGFLSQYLPWVIVPRSTYIYHYFASVPFIILATCWLFAALEKRCPQWKKWINAGLILLLLVSFGLFIAFYPYGTGILTRVEWLDAMKWFKGIWY